MKTKSCRAVLLLSAEIFLAALVPQSAGAQKTTKEPVAIVAGQAIYEDELLPLVQSQLLQMRNQEFEIKSRALESLVNEKLMTAQAERMGIPKEKLLEREVDSKLGEPTDTEIEAYYLGQRDRLGRPLDEIKAQLRTRLKQARVQQARQEYFNRLREQAEVTILLRPPHVQVGYDTARLRGSPNAPVMIVEFSDFQCPFCQRVQPTLRNLLAKYEGRVSLAFRDFPLRQIHRQAQMAAEASHCAGEQGKFWEYHDLLFANPGKLGREELIQHASALGFDDKRFESCLSDGKYKAQVEQDLEEGTRAGVGETPGFFVNGILLTGAQPAAAFERIIEAELAAKREHGPASPRQTPASPAVEHGPAR